ADPELLIGYSNWNSRRLPPSTRWMPSAASATCESPGKPEATTRSRYELPGRVNSSGTRLSWTKRNQAALRSTIAPDRSMIATWSDTESSTNVCSALRLRTVPRFLTGTSCILLLRTGPCRQQCRQVRADEPDGHGDCDLGSK